ncbi:MAG: hypothetical protein WC735_04970 [Candidatus Paceibacterota bacterium]|jgi:hypothetical protein
MESGSVKSAGIVYDIQYKCKEVKREMTKQNLEILEFEDKKTQAGKRYTRFKTNEGWMSCFDKKSCEDLKEQEGNTVSCDVTEQNGFKNIKKFLGEAGESEDNEPSEEKKSQDKPVISKFDSFPVSMKVSYAKDLIVAGKSQIEAVKIVKELEEAFKPEVPKAKRNFKKEIVMLLQKGGDAGIEGSVIESNLKMTEEEARVEIAKLLEDGICYEPKPGLIKFLG